VTANKIPVPDPIAPIKSAKIVNIPINIPPQLAAVGMYFSNVLTRDVSLCPYKIMS